MWIAKDKDGSVFIYSKKPKKETETWQSTNEYGFCIPTSDLSCDDLSSLRPVISLISWNDSEPLELKFHIEISGKNINNKAKKYEESIKDPNLPFYTPEDIIKAFEEGYKRGFQD